MNENYYQKLLEECPDVYADVINTLCFGGNRLLSAHDLEPGPAEAILAGLRGTARKNYLLVTMQSPVDRMVFSLLIVKEPAPPEIVHHVMECEAAYYTSGRFAELESLLVSSVLYFGTNRLTTPKSLISTSPKNPYLEKLKSFLCNYTLNLNEIALLPEHIRESFQSDFRFIADYLCQERESGPSPFYEPPYPLLHNDLMLEFLNLKKYEQVYMQSQKLLLRRLAEGECIGRCTFDGLLEQWGFEDAAMRVLDHTGNTAETASLLGISRQAVREMSKRRKNNPTNDKGE